MTVQDLFITSSDFCRAGCGRRLAEGMKKYRWLRGFRNITAIVLVLAVLLAAQRLVVPKYADSLVEGGFTEEYYEETTPHDVLMVGDCEVYESFSPVDLWRNFGITSYIRGSAQQLVWQSYYLLKEALRYETPKAVVFNVQALMHAGPQKEEYNRMTLDGMRWSGIKLDAVRASMLPEEKLVDYIFPVLRYHSRITQLAKEDIDYYGKHKKVSHNGYHMRVDEAPYVEGIWFEEEPDDFTFGRKPMEYLDEMRLLCESNGIHLVLVKAPSVSPVWYGEYEEQVEAYAERYGLPYINYLELLKETGIDYGTDTYDMGLHMNLSGAKKMTAYLGEFLVSRYGLRSHRGDKELERVWEEKEEFYEEMKAEQEAEIEKYGSVISY